MIMRMSQVIICFFGCFMGVMAIILLEIGISLGCVDYLMQLPRHKSFHAL